MRPFGDGFIKLIKMLIGPIIFSTVVVGVAHMGAMKDVGRIVVQALSSLRALRLSGRSSASEGWGSLVRPSSGA